MYQSLSQRIRLTPAHHWAPRVWVCVGGWRVFRSGSCSGVVGPSSPGCLASGGAGQNAAPVTLKGVRDVGSLVGSSRSPVAGVTPVRASDLRGSGLGSGSFFGCAVVRPLDPKVSSNLFSGYVVGVSWLESELRSHVLQAWRLSLPAARNVVCPNLLDPLGFSFICGFRFRVCIGIRFQKDLLSAVASLRPGLVGDKDVSAVKRSFYFGVCVWVGRLVDVASLSGRRQGCFMHVLFHSYLGC